MKYLVTGAAGFIGFHTVKKLSGLGNEIIGIDNLNEYYDVSLKKSRLEILNQLEDFDFVKLDLNDVEGVADLFKKEKFDKVIHLAAQAGVRYSLNNPLIYGESNVMGFMNILEGCRQNTVKHLVYASSSSVYGLNAKMPFSTSDRTDHPVSLYAATKKANELLAHSYSHLYQIPTTGLRFFTVYGPWGRPDMALFIFTKAILEDKPIDINNFGDMARDFTYIDDIVEGIIRIQDMPPSFNEEWSTKKGKPSESSAPYQIFNIGNGSPVSLMDFVNLLELFLEKEAVKNFLPMQPGDVNSTHAEVSDLYNKVNFKPSISIKTGVKNFIDWYRDYYGINN